MPDWMQGALSLGVGAGGVGIIVRALLAVFQALAKWGQHRAGADETTAKTVQSQFDRMSGATLRLENEMGQMRAAYEEIAEKYDALVKVVAVLRAENRELRTIIATGRGLDAPPAPLSMPPTLMDESVKRSEKDSR